MVKVKGLAELGKFLDNFPPKLQRNVLRGGLRAGVKVALPVAQQNIHPVSGLLAKGLKLGTRARGTTVKAYIKATGPHAPLAHLVEYGTRAHFIRAKDGKALFFGGRFVESIHHPGAKPHPFGRPALDRAATGMVVATGNYIANRLRTQYGLDAQDVDAGDE